MNPQTSVIIPVRNGARFIAAAIDSALAQLEAGDEVLVVDDASEDATREVVGQSPDPRVRLLTGYGHGVSSARNVGLAAAQGEFVAFLDHDDLWPEGRHATLRGILQSDPELDCAVGRIRLLMEKDAVMIPRLVGMDGRLAADLSLCTALFRRRILERVGGFDEGMRFCEDTDYFLRLTEHNYRIVLCEVDTLIYRRHGTNATCNEIASEDGLMELIRRRRRRHAAAAARET